MKEICFATNNKNKLKEIQSLLPDFKIICLEDIQCHEDLPENQTTLEGNANEKAQYVWDNYNVACFADDTGLEIEVLNGEPGVYSARYAGPQRNSDDNIRLVLKKLVNQTNRKAQFRTVICLINEEGKTFFEGVAKGNITMEKSGVDGFGYDPIFKAENSELTFAEISIEEKNKISHRGIAVRKLVSFFNE